METRILTGLLSICLAAVAIKLVMTEVASVIELWRKLSRGEDRK
jgi:hypothetical protein